MPCLQVLEYTLFQPGVLVDYCAPAEALKYIEPIEFFLDFQRKRAITLKDKDGIFTLTTLKDLANIVARAIEYEGEWPVIGGVHGSTLSTSKLVEIGTRVRGIY